MHFLVGKVTPTFDDWTLGNALGSLESGTPHHLETQSLEPKTLIGNALGSLDSGAVELST